MSEILCAMQLAGTGVFGPPRDHATALAVLREALHPYADDLGLMGGCHRRRIDKLEFPAGVS